MKTHFALLDLLRLAAAVWVMNFHYLFGLGLSGEVSWYRYGHLGVQLFFIISGFVIVRSLEHKTTREFACNRFVRLFPLFWILCTFTFVVTLLVPGAHPLHFGEYVVSMTMLGDVYNGFMHNSNSLIDPSYWTLGVELLFYICIAAFVAVFSHRRLRVFFASWLCVSMAAFALQGNENFYIKLLLVSHAAYFVFGGTLALCTLDTARGRGEKWIDAALLSVSSIYAIFIHPLALPLYSTPNHLDTPVVSWIHVGIFIVVPCMVWASKYIQNTRAFSIFALLGGLTYPLYLLHQTIGLTIMNYLVSRYYFPRLAVVVWFELVIILVAYLVYLFDQRFRRFFYSMIEAC